MWPSQNSLTLQQIQLQTRRAFSEFLVFVIKEVEEYQTQAKERASNVRKSKSVSVVLLYQYLKKYHFQIDFADFQDEEMSWIFFKFFLASLIVLT